MIIVRTPLRLSIAGGGTDIPSWYQEHGSIFVSAAIDKYIYLTLQRSPYNPKFNLRYSEIEEVEKTKDIKHDIIRATLQYFNITEPCQITSHADIPAGTGLGSSGSFGVAMAHILFPRIITEVLARDASKIQMESLHYPIGLQDQYAAAYGGIRKYTISKEGVVDQTPFDTPVLSEKLALFYTGQKRSATQILAHSSHEGLQEVQDIGLKQIEALEGQNYDNYGYLLNEHWLAKKKRHPEMSSPQIDEWYDLGLKNGALGGKLIGAGGGGFLMFYTNEPEKLIKAMPLYHQPFTFDEGSKIIYEDIS